MSNDHDDDMNEELSSSWLSGTTFTRLFLYFAKSNSSHTLVDLIFLPYLIYSRDPYLILPIYLHVHSLTLLIFLSKYAGYYYDIIQGQTKNYLLVGGRTILLGQLEGDLGPH